MVTLLDGDPGLDFAAMREQMLHTIRGGKKHDTRWYWKRPHKHQDGSLDLAPGWVFWASNDAQSTRFVEQTLLLGWIPLPKYGTVQQYSQGEAIDLINQGKLDPRCPDQYGPWGRILCHPDGPAEFPADQIITFKWYDPANCPVPNVRFPQLQGQTITEYDCPECNTVVYAKPVHLARHLRNTHNYDRQEIIALGEELGINFGKELVKSGRIERVYTYDEAEFGKGVEAAAATRTEPSVVVERIRPQGRSSGKVTLGFGAATLKEPRERMARGTAASGKLDSTIPPGRPKARKNGWTPERRKAASEAAKARLAAQAGAA